jgi:hypothetical protein
MSPVVPNKSTLSSMGVSMVVHAILLGVMATWYLQNEREEEEVVVESVIKEEERPPEQITQQLEESNEISQNMNTISGGAVALATGSTANPTVKKVNITESLVKTDLKFNAQVSMPGDSELGDELGEGEVTGEVGAVVDGYGPALSRLAQEIIRLMREQKVLVVWLFDQSDSMKDDNAEIAAKFHKVYEELGIAQQKDEKLKSRIQDQILQTMIVAYGEKVTPQIKAPTADLKEIEEAIKKIPIDPAAKKTCAPPFKKSWVNTLSACSGTNADW